MEIKQLEYFLAVSGTKSFTRAAEQLYVSQPSVTNTIRALETELGIQLFERSQKQAVLTSEGRIFHNHVEHLMKGISHTLDEIQAIRNLSGGVMSLGVSPMACVPASFSLIREFLDEYPEIRLQLTENSPQELQRLLMEGKLDAAMLVGGETIPALEYLPVESLEMVVCFARRHSLRRHNALRLEDLEGETWILPSAESASLLSVEAALSTGELKTKRIDAEEVQTIKGLVAAGCGISVLPETLCEGDDSLSSAVLEPPLQLPLALVYKANRHQSHATEAFLAFARKGGDCHA